MRVHVELNAGDSHSWYERKFRPEEFIKVGGIRVVMRYGGGETTMNLPHAHRLWTREQIVVLPRCRRFLKMYCDWTEDG